MRLIAPDKNPGLKIFIKYSFCFGNSIKIIAPANADVAKTRKNIMITKAIKIEIKLCGYFAKLKFVSYS